MTLEEICHSIVSFRSCKFCRFKRYWNDASRCPCAIFLEKKSNLISEIKSCFMEIEQKAAALDRLVDLADKTLKDQPLEIQESVLAEWIRRAKK